MACFGARVFDRRKFIEPFAFAKTCNHESADAEDSSLSQGAGSRSAWRRYCNKAFFLPGWNVDERTKTSLTSKAKLTASEYV